MAHLVEEGDGVVERQEAGCSRVSFGEVVVVDDHRDDACIAWGRGDVDVGCRAVGASARAIRSRSRDGVGVGLALVLVAVNVGVARLLLERAHPRAALFVGPRVVIMQKHGH